MKSISIFPEVEFSNKPESENIQIQTYGKRITKDQTLSEYLIEFLLVFIGDKLNGDGFDSYINIDKPIQYKVNPNIALKRFIFLENSKSDNRFGIDEDANNKLKSLLAKKIESDSLNKEEILFLLNQLFLGFSAVTKERGWFAKALLPMCRHTIFCETMGKKSQRKNLKFIDNDNSINLETDKKFEFKEYNFQARGGEFYYLHLLQGFNAYSREYGQENADKIKLSIETKLNSLINSFLQVDKLAKWIQDTWYDFLHNETGISNVKNELSVMKTCQWILKDYEERSKLSIKEIDNLLNTDTSEFEKMELLTIAIELQLLRALTETASNTSGNPSKLNPMWLVHIPSNYPADKNIKKLAIEKYKEIEENMIIAVSKLLENADEYRQRSKKKRNDKSDISLLKSAYDDSHKLLRKLGKQIGLIIPVNGPNMRFTISDKIIRFLVLALIKPDSKVTLNTFLELLYKHFGIVIREKEYTEHMIKVNKEDIKDNKIDAAYLQYNLLEFQSLLRDNGFLKELSDATAIVINPYRRLEDME